MNYKKLQQKVICAEMLLIFLAGCGGNSPVATATSISPSDTPAPTLTAMPTLTSTITPSPTSTPIPIPPMPTFEVIGKYGKPKVKITDRQGVETTMVVESVLIEDDVALTYGANPYSLPDNFPLKIADDIYALIPWCSFRRAYLSEGKYVVTMDNGQEFTGQLNFKLNGIDIQSYIAIVIEGLSQTDLDLCHIKTGPATHTLHILKPMDRTFAIRFPSFVVEYYTSRSGASRGADSTEFFSAGLDDVTRNLANQDEVRLNNDGQITAITNGVEKTGALIPILKTTYGEIFHKGTTPNWYLKVFWVDAGFDLFIQVPAWTLTQGSQ